MSPPPPWRAPEQSGKAPFDAELSVDLLERPIPSARLASTAGGMVDVARLAVVPVIFYVHPGTETLSHRNGALDLPGRGCTAQSQGFHKHILDFHARRVSVVGLTSQPIGKLEEFANRERLAFALLSDSKLDLANALGLRTVLAADGSRVYERITLFASHGVIEKVFDPIPAPRHNALEVLSWLEANGIGA